MLVQLGDVEGAHDMLAKVYNMQLEQAQLSQEDPAVLATTARSASIMLAENKFADAMQCFQSVSYHASQTEGYATFIFSMQQLPRPARYLSAAMQ